MLLFTLYIRVHSLHSTYRIYYIFSQIQSTRNNNEPIFKIHAMPFSRWATFVKPLASPKEWSYCNLHPLPMGRYAPSDGLVISCEAHCLFRVSRCLRWNLPVVSRTNFAVGKLLSIPTHVMTPAHCILCGPGMVASITSHAFHFGQTILSLSVVGFPTSTHSMYFLRHVPHLQCLSPHLIISYQVVLLLLATPSGLIQVHFIFASHLLVAFPVNLHLHPFQIPVHLQDLQWFLLQSAFHKPCMAQLPLSLQAPSPLSFLLHVPHL